MEVIQKSGEILQPIEGEVWVPIHAEGDIPATDAFFISTEGRVAKLHVAPNPYTQTPWIAFISAGIYRGAAGPVVDFSIRDGGYVRKKRKMLARLFINAFLGVEFLPKSVNKKLKISGTEIKSVDADINIRSYGGPVRAFLYRRYRILEENLWLTKANYAHRIWENVLGDPTVQLSKEHEALNKRTCVFCDTMNVEWRDPTGALWRPIILEDISEIESYWISSTGIVVQFPGVLDGPSDDRPVQFGITCTTLTPQPQRNGPEGTGYYVYLKDVTGRYSYRSIRNLVYKIFINPDFTGKVLAINKTFDAGTHLLFTNE